MKTRFLVALLFLLCTLIPLGSANAKTNGRWPVVVNGHAYSARDFHQLMTDNTRRLRNLEPSLRPVGFVPQFTNLANAKWRTPAEIRMMITKMLALKKVLDHDGAPLVLGANLVNYRAGRPIAVRPAASPRPSPKATRVPSLQPTPVASVTPISQPTPAQAITEKSTPLPFVLMALLTVAATICLVYLVGLANNYLNGSRSHDIRHYQADRNKLLQDIHDRDQNLMRSNQENVQLKTQLGKTAERYQQATDELAALRKKLSELEAQPAVTTTTETAPAIALREIGELNQRLSEITAERDRLATENEKLKKYSTDITDKFEQEITANQANIIARLNLEQALIALRADTDTLKSLVRVTQTSQDHLKTTLEECDIIPPPPTTTQQKIQPLIGQIEQDIAQRGSDRSRKK